MTYTVLMTAEYLPTKPILEFASTMLFKTYCNKYYNNNNFRVSNIRVLNRTLIYNVCPEAALT